MPWRNLLTPQYRFKKITDVKSDFFAGAALIIFDIDNTLFVPSTTQIPEDILTWFLDIKSRYPCVCFSNSFTIQWRQKEIEKLLGCEVYLSKHKKPSQKLFAEIKQRYAKEGTVFVVGDLLVTDVLFANKGGAISVLIEPFTTQERMLIKIVRYLEKIMYNTIIKYV